MNDWVKKDELNVDDLVEATDRIFDNQEKEAVSFVPLSTYADEAQVFIENWGRKQGYLTGIESVDDLTYGMTLGELVILAGTPGIGKSALIANLSIKLAQQGNLVTIINLELPNAQLATRVHKATDGNWEDLPIIVQEQKGELTAKTLEHKIKEVIEGGSKIIIIDYLQLLMGNGKEYEEISNVVRSLKNIAVSHNVLVIAISSLNRSRVMGELDMSALQGSGKIEFYADMILFLDRDQEDGEIFIKIVKNRSRKYDYKDNKRYLKFDGAKFESPQGSTAKELPGDDLSVTVANQLFPHVDKD